MATNRLNRDRLRPFGLGRSPLAKMLDEVDRLDAASRAAHQAFDAARAAKQRLPRDLVEKAAAAATAGEDVDLEKLAGNVETALVAAQAKAKGTLDARTAAVRAVGAFLRSDDGAEARAKLAAEIEDRRARALELLQTATVAVDDLADALAVAETIVEPPTGATPSLDVKAHPLGRAAKELAAQVAAAAPAPPRKPAAGNVYPIAMH
jgi:hypothetical protein